MIPLRLPFLIKPDSISPQHFLQTMMGSMNTCNPFALALNSLDFLKYLTGGANSFLAVRTNLENGTEDLLAKLLLQAVMLGGGSGEF